MELRTSSENEAHRIELAKIVFFGTMAAATLSPLKTILTLPQKMHRKIM